MTEPVEVVCDKDKSVAYVTLNRPEKLNAINLEMIDQLRYTFKELASNDDIHVVVLRGKGKSFCAGADYNWMQASNTLSPVENYEESLKLAEMYDLIKQAPQVVICGAQGPAYGGGACLVAASDIVIASVDARFGFPEPRLGLVPALLAPLAREKIGESNLRALAIIGDTTTATDAQRMGLVHEVVENERGLDLAIERKIEKALEAEPMAMRETKKLIARTYSTEEAARIFADRRVLPEAQRRIASFLARKKETIQSSAETSVQSTQSIPQPHTAATEQTTNAFPSYETSWSLGASRLWNSALTQLLGWVYPFSPSQESQTAQITSTDRDPLLGEAQASGYQSAPVMSVSNVSSTHAQQSRLDWIRDNPVTDLCRSVSTCCR